MKEKLLSDYASTWRYTCSWDIKNLLGCYFLPRVGNRTCMFLLVTFICAPCWLFGQTTWTGAVSRVWDNSGNWTAGVPDAVDDVIIPNMPNDPVMHTNGAAKSVYIQVGASLNLSGSGNLLINGSATQAILNEGELINFGTITIGSGGVVGMYGIVNRGKFTNDEEGLITLGGASNYGIWNNTGTFTNEGELHISSGTRCIYNEAIFLNASSY